tara:strand:+ start:9659 stop:10108 length:450 start_codon:yes stop_codon:yes gene_type:complete
MEVILLEKIIKLGDPGDLVIVKKGYARNFLIPSGKAVTANEKNKEEYEQRRTLLENAEEERKKNALEISNKLKSLEVFISVAVSEEGSLYGSVGTREISEAILSQGIEIEKSSVRLPEGPLKELGNYMIEIELHPEVIQPVSVSLVSEQ